MKKAFKDAGCWNFCKKLQGGHAQVTKDPLFFSCLKIRLREQWMNEGEMAVLAENGKGLWRKTSDCKWKKIENR